MTPDEWESLCDRCGTCCLLKLEYESTGEVKLLGVSCEFLDTETSDCLVYECRRTVNPDCLVLNPNNIEQMTWLPKTCAYRLIFEGKDLHDWHPLISGDPDTVYQAGVSVRDKAVSAKYIHFKDMKDLTE